MGDLYVCQGLSTTSDPFLEEVGPLGPTCPTAFFSFFQTPLGLSKVAPSFSRLFIEELYLFDHLSVDGLHLLVSSYEVVQEVLLHPNRGLELFDLTLNLLKLAVNQLTICQGLFPVQVEFADFAPQLLLGLFLFVAI